MKILQRSKDGGPLSRVWGYFLVELKALFSIVLLRFDDGSRDAYHSHAFGSVSWVLRGKLVEVELLPGFGRDYTANKLTEYRPSWRPVITRRSTYHRVVSIGTTWVLSFRGPWSKTWREYDPRTEVETTLTHGRKQVL